MTHATATPAPDRRARRKAETRAKLVDAARRVFARQGIDATRINQITEEADVGFGSFYNHFQSKEDIVAAVVEQTIAEAGATIDRATSDITDPAEVVAVAHRSLVAWAAANPEFAWLLVRLDTSHDAMLGALGSYAARDLQRGIDAGRFSVEDRNIALVASGGALLAVIRAVLEGRAGQTAGERHAAGVLRMFGLPTNAAAEVAARPLPAMPPIAAPAPRRPEAR
jgi:AcrR family transcriptional regulator